MNPASLETKPCRVYKLGSRFFVPHYHKKNTFVGPGNVEMSYVDLQNLEAEPSTLDLWVRNWTTQARIQGDEMRVPQGVAA